MDFNKMKIWNISCHQISNTIDDNDIKIGCYANNPNVKYLLCKDFYDQKPSHELFSNQNDNTYEDKIELISRFLESFGQNNFKMVVHDLNWCFDKFKVIFIESKYLMRIIGMINNDQILFSKRTKSNVKIIGKIFEFLQYEASQNNLFYDDKLIGFDTDCILDFKFSDLMDDVKYIY